MSGPGLGTVRDRFSSMIRNTSKREQHMENENDRQTIAQAFADAFETATRDNGETFYRLVVGRAREGGAA